MPASGGAVETRTVTITDTRDTSSQTRQVTLRWRCPECGGPRGIARPQGRLTKHAVRYSVDHWANPCGHLERVSGLNAEADAAILTEGLDEAGVVNWTESVANIIVAALAERDHYILTQVKPANVEDEDPRRQLAVYVAPALLWLLNHTDVEQRITEFATEQRQVKILEALSGACDGFAVRGLLIGVGRVERGHLLSLLPPGVAEGSDGEIYRTLRQDGMDVLEARDACRSVLLESSRSC